MFFLAGAAFAPAQNFPTFGRGFALRLSPKGSTTVDWQQTNGPYGGTPALAMHSSGRSTNDDASLPVNGACQEGSGDDSSLSVRDYDETR